MILLTIVAALLRIPLLTRPMGTDEAATFIYYASHPLHIGLTIYGSPNNHILHTAMMHASFRMFGQAEWALRLPAFLAGVAMIPLTYLASRALAPRGALLAAALTAATPALIDYSTDARGYTLLCCFVLICAASMAEVVRSGSRTAAIIFALSAALGFYTVPVMLYPFVMFLVWGRKRAIPAGIGAIVLTAVFYSAALVVSGWSALTSNPYVRPLPLRTFLSGLLPYLATVREHLFVGVPLILQILIAIGFIIAVRRQPMWIGFTAVILLIVLQRVLPFPRVWLPFLPLIFITAAAAWAWERTEPLVAAAAVILLAITGMTTNRVRETGELRAVREIARELRFRAQPGDPVLALPPSEMPLAYYYRQVEVLHPDLRRTRIFVIENRDYGQTLERTLAFFKIDPRGYAIRQVRDFGSAGLYELTAH